MGSYAPECVAFIWEPLELETFSHWQQLILNALWQTILGLKAAQNLSVQDILREIFTWEEFSNSTIFGRGLFRPV